MTTNTAAHVARHGEKDKEKVEKRRALGRGLASLLPGPRVLNPFAKKEDAGSTVVAPGSHGPDGRSSAVIPAAPSQDSGSLASTSVATKAESTNRAAHAADNPRFSQHQGEVGHPRTVSPPVAAGSQSTVAEVRSAGPFESAQGMQVGVAVPTDEGQNPHAVAQNATSMGHAQEIPSGSAIATGVVDYEPFDEAPAGGVIEIQAVADTRLPSNLVVNLAISDVDKNPFQTRYVEDDDALEELADSIKANGVVQPIVVRPAQEDGRYILILGERRLHASKKAGKTHIPALVRRVSEQQAAEMTIIENLQREDLSPLEQAEAFRVLSNKFSMTQQQIAERVGLSRTSIANYMRLLKLPREVMQMLAEKRLNFAQAKELLKLGENDRIAEAALYAVKKGMNIEQIEMLVLRMDGLLDPLPDMPGVQKEKKSSGARWVDPNVRSAQMDLERMLGVRVRIRDRKGRGKIVIEYSTVDDYERVVEMLRGKK
ncbi:MAG TPA: ParB/RepB/Spo0J family partition protein [Candidatus Sulfotelmatobacter sp.]|nr:ParB/RepB/Spo0J family partition protein [Candidatus Sulfotelmatobacter sp.]